MNFQNAKINIFYLKKTSAKKIDAHFFQLNQLILNRLALPSASLSLYFIEDNLPQT